MIFTYRDLFVILAYLFLGASIVAPLTGTGRDGVDAPLVLRWAVYLVLIAAWPFYAAFMLSATCLAYLLTYHRASIIETKMDRLTAKMTYIQDTIGAELLPVFRRLAEQCNNLITDPNDPGGTPWP